MAEIMNSYTILVGKHERKRFLGWSLREYEDNIKLYRKDIRYDGVNWSHLAQDRDQWWALVNTIMNVMFCKRRETHWQAELLLAPQEGLSCVGILRLLQEARRL
jgi:hypothetical protein